MSPCPPVDLLLGFASGDLSDEMFASVEAHIDECAACRTSLSNLAQRDVAATTFGRYQLQTVLGSGGMGIVYRAWDPQLARPLAIKVLKQAGADEATRARLVREAQSLARLSHPHVCHVYDVGTEGAEVWVAMELIEGVTLRAWAGEHDRAELLGVLLDAAEGIAAAHAAGIVHRDVKPENVLVTREGRAIVTDFGLARVDAPIDPAASTVSMDPHMTATGAVVGTPAYLAPEQLTGSPLDARVDQFAWAVMAWELLTGMRPFPILAAVRLDAIRAGLTPPASLAAPIAAALARAMQLAPRDRFTSMTALIADVRAAAARKPTRKRAPWIAAVGAVLAGGVAVAAVMHAKTSETPAPVVAVAPPAVEMPAPAIAATPTPPAPAPVTAPTTSIATPPQKAGPPPRANVRLPTPATKALTNEPTAASAATAPPLLDPLARPFTRDRAIGVMNQFCHLPIDAAHPDPKLGRPIIDWGKVTRRERVTGTIGKDMTRHLTLYEVVGQRATYHFDGDEWNESIGQFDARIGDLVALCQDDIDELFTLPGAWHGPLGKMMAMLPISAPPRMRELAKLDPLHISDVVLLRDGKRGKLELDPSRRYLVRSNVVAADGARWEMEGWWLEVPPRVAGAALVKESARPWIVVEQLHFEDDPEGGKPHLVGTAAAVLDSMFPE